MYKGVNYAIDIFIGSDTTDMNGVVVAKPHANDLYGQNGDKLLPRSKVTRIRNKAG